MSKVTLARVWLVAFLAVLLGGVGGGAAALWSQRASGVVDVATGSWGVPVSAAFAGGGGPLKFDGAFTWTPRVAQTESVTYTIAVSAVSNAVVTKPTTQVAVTVAPGASGQTPLTFEKNNNSAPGELVVTITPSSDGVAGLPSKWRVVVDGKQATVAEDTGP